jgi:hypothetical protein
VLGRVDELVVLKCLAGLLVHWAESSFGLRAMAARRDHARTGVGRGSFSLSAGRGFRSIACKLQPDFLHRAGFRWKTSGNV